MNPLSKTGIHAFRRLGITALALVGILLLAIAFPGCTSSQEAGKNEATGADQSDKVQVIASFYPLYDFAQKIGGERVEVTNLVPAGTEPHDWEPSTTDIRTLENADILVFNGAGMEHWTDDVLSSLTNDRLIAVEASDGVTLRAAGEEEADGEDHGSYDPHVWLAPENAKVEMENIKDALIQADPDGTEYYEANYAKWAQECDDLDEEFSQQLENAPSKDIVVSHEAFGYLCEAYGLNQVPIEGIDAEAEPSAQQLAEITDFVKENGVRVIFSEELVSPKIAQTIADATGATMKELNPLEGLTDEELSAGEDYFSVMRSNLQELKEALS